MIVLENAHLRVEVLDPVADRERMGTRYCTGGYIFQVVDAELGPLLSGPTYPHSFNVFDGQGIPDAFSRQPLRQREDPDLALVIGIGLVDLASDAVREFCDWDIAASGGSVTMHAVQTLGPYALELTRTVALAGRTVTSRIDLRNTGAVGIQTCWFPHPFFPQPNGDELCLLNIPLRMAPNPGYELSPGGFIARKNWPWDEGYYLALDHDARENAVIVQRHPRLGLVVARCSYVPRFFPIWGNRNTFSWEPYFENTIAPGQELEWSIDYVF